MKELCQMCRGDRIVMSTNLDTGEEKQVWCSWCDGKGWRDVTVGGYPVKED